MIVIYNTFSRKKEEFKPVNNDKKVRLYSCGATVQGEPHIGHIRAAITADIIMRTLTLAGYEMISVYNFTDIEDKLIEKSNETGMDYRKIAADNIDKYMYCMNKLNIMRFTFYPNATKHIQEIIELIEELIDKGYAYEKDGNVYFRVKKFNDYGKLSGKNIDQLISGKRVDVDKSKESPLDFTLWKKHINNEPYWNAPFGKGRPGWHIECSAMSMKYLGKTFDIHTGGQDLIFPHHENEIAQSTAITCAPLANYWAHNGMVNLKGEKMSKSIGNVFAIESLLKKYSGNVIRMYLFKTHYRKDIEFSLERMDEAKNAYKRITDALSEIKIDENKINNKRFDKFKNVLFDDFNTPEAIALIFESVNCINRGENKELEASTIIKMMSLLGFDYQKTETMSDNKDIMNILIAARDHARNKNDYETSDYIRDLLLKKGIELKDKKGGTSWIKHD